MVLLSSSDSLTSTRSARADDGRLIAGIDVGTTNIKVSVYDLQGHTVAQASTATFTHHPRPLWAHFEPEELWNQVVLVLREVTGQLDRPERVAGLAVASMGEAGVPLDANGEPTHEIIAWFDRRTIGQSQWLESTIGLERLFDITGLAIQPILTLCKLLWLKEHAPAAWSRTVRWLMVADYIAFRLCGVQATDYSLASRSLAFNIHSLSWDADLLDTTGIPSSILASLVQSGTALDTVTQEVATLTGLSTRTLVAAGGHDHVCGALAAGVLHRGQMLDSMGTAEALFLPLTSPIADRRLAHQGYSQGAHVAAGKYYVLGNVFTSGGSVEWFRDISGHDAYEILIPEARIVPPGSHGAAFLPHLRLGSPPHPDPKARAAFVGLTSDITRGALLRAVFEGLAYDARSTVEPLLTYAELYQMPDITVIGGSTRNELLLEIKASVLKTPHQILDLEEATCLGAAILGGIAAGIYRDADDAFAHLDSQPRTIEPDHEAAAFYEEWYSAVYERLFRALQPIHQTIHDLVVDASSEWRQNDSTTSHAER